VTARPQPSDELILEGDAAVVGADGELGLGSHALGPGAAGPTHGGGGRSRQCSVFASVSRTNSMRLGIAARTSCKVPAASIPSPIGSGTSRDQGASRTASSPAAGSRRRKVFLAAAGHRFHGELVPGSHHKNAVALRDHLRRQLRRCISNCRSHLSHHQHGVVAGGEAIARDDASGTNLHVAIFLGHLPVSPSAMGSGRRFRCRRRELWPSCHRGT